MAEQSNLSAPTRSIDEAVGQTDITVFIGKYKMAIIAIVSIAILSLLGVALYSHFADKNFQKYAERGFVFSETTLTELNSGKLAAGDFVSKFKTLADETNYYEGLTPVAVSAADMMLTKGENQAVVDLLRPLLEKRSFARGVKGLFLRSRLATALENLQDYNGAIEHYEWLANNNGNVLSAKFYTDLGRMYLLTKNNERAKASFKYVVENYKASEFYRVAQIYLMEMGAE